MSLHGTELQKYTSWIGHRHEAVKQILITDKGILSLSETSVHYAQRTGPPIWHLTDPSFANLQCMGFAAKAQREILVAGGQNTMIKIDIEKGQVTEVVGIQFLLFPLYHAANHK